MRESSTPSYITTILVPDMVWLLSYCGIHLSVPVFLLLEHMLLKSRNHVLVYTQSALAAIVFIFLACFPSSPLVRCLLSFGDLLLTHVVLVGLHL